MKPYIPMLFLGLLLASSDDKGDAPASAPNATKQAMETTTATGYGKTHEDAYQEALSQAVSQVCGVDVAKAIVGVPTHTHLTTDDKGVVGGISFEGVVRRCKVISEEQADDGSFKVTVEAVVCPPADVFSKRLARAGFFGKAAFYGGTCACAFSTGCRVSPRTWISPCWLQTSSSAWRHISPPSWRNSPCSGRVSPSRKSRRRTNPTSAPRF